MPVAVARLTVVVAAPKLTRLLTTFQKTMNNKASKPKKSEPEGFINVPVTRETREGLHHLKESMGAASQAEVIEKAIAILLAIQNAARS
jgi:hypothetical protein